MIEKGNEGKGHTLVARVVSDKMDRTRTVVIERLVKHALYKKYIRRTTRLHIHDEHNQARTGDLVRIVPSRPYSKTKFWRLVDIVRKMED